MARGRGNLAQPDQPVPNVDWGYDVADYTDVHSDLGSLADLDRLVAEAGRRGIRVLRRPRSEPHVRPASLVPRAARVLRLGGRVPNNWQAIFGGGSAWELDDARGRYYLHNFAKEQPDLDWWNPEVRAEFERILRFWLDRGIAGFRIDVAHGLFKDRELRDDARRSERVHSMNRPETHEVYRQWRRLGRRVRAAARAARRGLCPRHPGLGRVLRLGVGRAEPRLQLRARPRRTSTPSEMRARRRRVRRRRCRRTPGRAGSDRTTTWGGFTTRWCGGDEWLARCALLMLLTLRGTPSLYYGDELALPDGQVPPDRVRDVAVPSRDPCRTPMPWTREGGWDGSVAAAGGHEPERRGSARRPGSTLNFTRDLIGAPEGAGRPPQPGHTRSSPRRRRHGRGGEGDGVVVADQPRLGRGRDRRSRRLDCPRDSAGAAKASLWRGAFG